MIVKNEPSEAYHASPHLGSTTAKLALKSMQLMRDRLTGVDACPDAPHFQVGRLAHLMVLEPERFAQLVTAKGPINEKTGRHYGRDTVAFAAWQTANPGVTVVEPWLYLSLERMPHEVCELVNGGESEVSVYQHLPALGFGVKCRPDHLKGNVIVDVKTIDDVDNAERAINRFQYWFSHAWYRMAMKLETGDDFKFRLIFAEKKPPYRWRIIDLAPDFVHYADGRVEEILGKIGDAYRTGNWSDDAPVVREAQMPAYLDSEDFAIDAEGGISL